MRKLTGLLATVILFAAREARADGNETLGLTLDQSGKGLSAVTFGIGLSAGRNVTTPTPITKASLDVVGLPANAKIEKAFLYWVTYGPAGNPSMTFDGQQLTGALIGAGAGTCWTEFPGATNFAYRNDITARITGNAKHELTGFPSASTGTDTQGAAIVIVYSDPAADFAGSVILHDGLRVMNNSTFKMSFANVTLPKTLLAANLYLGVGDGQDLQADGTIEFNDQDLALLPGAGNGHFTGTAGNYWDSPVYDVKAELLKKPLKNNAVPLIANYAADCLAVTYAGLTIRAPLGELPDGGAGEDGGGAPSSSSSGAGGASSSSGTPAGTSVDGGLNITPGAVATEDGSDGCGCRTTARSHAPLGAIALVLAALGLRSRRRR